MAHRKILRLALHFYREGQAAVDAYNDEVAEWYRRGDGRAPNWRVEITEDGEVYRYNAGGQGYAFPQCIHGSSRWTDYDNICWGCEESFLPNDRAYCLAKAKQALTECERRVDMVTGLLMESTLDQSAKDALIAWAVEPVPATPDFTAPKRNLP